MLLYSLLRVWNLLLIRVFYFVVENFGLFGNSVRTCFVLLSVYSRVLNHGWIIFMLCFWNGRFNILDYSLVDVMRFRCALE